MAWAAAALLWLVPTAPAAETGTAVGTARSSSRQPRLLFIALDAVPFEVARRVQEASPGAGAEAPVLEGFSPVTALISSFPSTTTPALTGILEPFGVEAAPGYEASFFDRDRNKVRGGMGFSYLRIDFAWREFFDYRRKSIIMRGVKKLNPIEGSQQELAKGLRKFLESEAPAFFIYSALTDAAGHLRSPESLERVLRDLDRMLAELRREHPETPFHTVIFSDHGMAGGEPLENVRRAIRQALEENGWRVRKRLKRPNDVVFAPFGLVSSFEVFTQPGRGQDAARLLAAVPGVDLCVTAEDGGWRIHGGGEATVHRRREGERVLWSYQPGEGDPLGYGPVVERLRQRAGSERGGAAGDWFPDDWWFEATRFAEYPDALHRAARSFDLVENQASALCSLAHGYMHGARLTEISANLSVGDLRWTHGALHREASLGFLTTDLPGFEPVDAVRFDRALAPFSDFLAPPPAQQLASSSDR